MKFVSLAAAAASLAGFVSLAVALLPFPLPSIEQVTPGTFVIATYDLVYDSASLPLADVTCSNGPYGLMSQGYGTLGALPTFPNVGGVYTVTGWNSPACGKCYNVTYNGGTNVKNVTILAVDAAPSGVNLSWEAMNNLTNGLAYQLGSVNVTVTEINPSACGLSSNL